MLPTIYESIQHNSGPCAHVHHFHSMLSPLAPLSSLGGPTVIQHPAPILHHRISSGSPPSTP